MLNYDAERKGRKEKTSLYASIDDLSSEAHGTYACFINQCFDNFLESKVRAGLLSQAFEVKSHSKESSRKASAWAIGQSISLLGDGLDTDS